MEEVWCNGENNWILKILFYFRTHMMIIQKPIFFHKQKVSLSSLNLNEREIPYSRLGIEDIEEQICCHYELNLFCYVISIKFNILNEFYTILYVWILKLLFIHTRIICYSDQRKKNRPTYFTTYRNCAIVFSKFAKTSM